MLVTPTIALAALIGSSPAPEAASAQMVVPQIAETRTIDLTQTVTLHDIPAGADQVRMWVPVPSDRNWQRVLDLKVVSAPGEWKLVPQPDGRGDLIYVELDNPQAGDADVVIQCTVERQGVYFDPATLRAEGYSIDDGIFAEDLIEDAPLMMVDPKLAFLASEFCQGETDMGQQAVKLMQGVATENDHYSKDPTKPHCGRGAAEDCMENGGGCCTDLHSLYIALARSRSIPSRIQFGYRALDKNEGKDFDPGYRCWVESFIPGAGWVPNDIVASDNAEDNPRRWVSLSASKVWLWEGRSFELSPAANAGRIDTMLVGWAEIDGEPVRVLPTDDGTPSPLRRTVKFNTIESQVFGPAGRPGQKLPE